jgi:glycosyltransferase involved in cell wall biosynthesis
MRIAYLMQAGVPDVRRTPPTGPSNHVRHTLEELRNFGNQVRLLACLDGKIWKSDDLAEYTLVPVNWLDRGPIHSFERLVRRIQSTIRLPYAAIFDSVRFALACQHELIGYDLFYERMGWMGYGGSLASKVMNIPLVLEVNGDHLSELKTLGMEPRGAQRLVSMLLMKMVARQADHTVATGEGWRHQHIRRWHVNPSRVKVIENGTDVVTLLRREQLRCFRAASDSNEPVRLIYVGAFEPWHGLDVIIHAIAQAVSQGIHLSATLVGAGSLSNDTERLIHDLHLEAYVTLTGELPVRQVAGLLANAEVGLSSYCGRTEYSGLKILDYKAAGLATIASGEKGQPAAIKHGCTGLIVQPCSVDELAGAIVYLSSNGQTRRDFGRQARVEAELRHKWAHTAHELQEVFSRVLNDHNHLFQQ